MAEIQDAYKLLTPLLGAGASTAFALALLASGQNSTLTGTLAGQIVMEGFLNIRIRPWLRRLITRLIAIVPAAIVAIFYGESGTAQLLILSQVILSLQLSFAVFPLVMFTSDRAKMGAFANAMLAQGAGVDRRARDRGAQRVAARPNIPQLDGMMYKRILVPLEHSAYDATILEHVRKLAKFCGASIVLIHVADGLAARNMEQLDLRESEEMRSIASISSRPVHRSRPTGLDAECLLAAGDPAKEISAAAAREGCDLIAMSTHGHRFIKDMLYGSVANEVRHMSRVPVLLVRGQRDQTPSSTHDASSS